MEAVTLHSQKPSTKQSLKLKKVFSEVDDLFYIAMYGIKSDKYVPKNLVSKFEQLYKCNKCSLEPTLAGKLPQKVCDIIRNLSKSRTRALPFQNNILFYGSPGTGKTIIAREIARKTGAEFHSYSASNIVSKYRGSGAVSVEEIFKKVQHDLDREKLVVLFVDEIDAIARDRADVSGLHRDHADALNQFLVRISEYKDNPRVVIIFATNMIDLLDRAIRSRVDAVEVPMPDEEMCQDLFKHYLSK